MDGNFGNVKSFLSFVPLNTNLDSGYGNTRKNKIKGG
jgi:hypothetical protein